MRANLSPFKNLRHDFPASVVVFLVALPLCLGIALASGAPLLAGLISGIVGGVVVAWLSGSPLAVSGPAAGLTVIVLTAQHDVGSWSAFLLAVMLAGVFQLGLGFARAGIIGYYFPSSVIKGLLAAIGVILILKQIPHAIGWDADYEGDFAFEQPDGRNTFTEIPYALEHVQFGAAIIGLSCLVLLILWSKLPRIRDFRWLPGPLVAVLLGVGINELFGFTSPELLNRADLLVQLPSGGDVLSTITFPDFSSIGSGAVWKSAAILAVVASVETLLSVDAIDRLDPFNRSSDTNRELKAQGVGNILCGLIGGLPITAVIVRGSANVQAGARTPMSSFLHGILLLISVLTIPWLLSRIPLAALAAVLLFVGYKLTPLSLYRRMYRRGLAEFVPFVVTVLAILFTDLLVGVAIGMGTGIFFILRANLAAPYFMHRGSAKAHSGPSGSRSFITIELSENVSFLNKAAVSRALDNIPDGAVVEIDARRSFYIDRDVLEIIHEFAEGAHYRGIEVRLIDVPDPDAPPGDLLDRKPISTDGDSPPKGLGRKLTG